MNDGSLKGKDRREDAGLDVAGVVHDRENVHDQRDHGQDKEEGAHDNHHGALLPLGREGGEELVRAHIPVAVVDGSRDTDGVHEERHKKQQQDLSTTAF